MSEDEILKILNDQDVAKTWNYSTLWAVKGLLDLYNKEKEKNKELEETGIELATNIDALETDLKELRDILSQIKVSEVYIKGYEAGKNEFEIKVREKIEKLEKIKEEHSKSFNWADWEDEDVYNEMITWFKELLQEGDK